MKESNNIFIVNSDVIKFDEDHDSYKSLFEKFDSKKKVNAKIMVDGSIRYKESEGSIHKIAAKIMGAESYNGWTYWHCNINGNSVVIDTLRQKFFTEKKF